jgi:hypothetical protein
MFLETILADAVHIDDAARRHPSAIAGRWRSRLGSTMELTVDEDHRVHGNFHTAVGVLDPNRPYPVVGFAEDDALSFSVDFGRHGSVAAWAGFHIEDESSERLVMLWHLTQPVRHPHNDADVWGALLAGSDEFTRDEG